MPVASHGNRFGHASQLQDHRQFDRFTSSDPETGITRCGKLRQQFDGHHVLAGRQYRKTPLALVIRSGARLAAHERLGRDPNRGAREDAALRIPDSADERPCQ